ncbi:MAG: hypothetical protein ABL889_22630 [Terricaulis sp.]
MTLVLRHNASHELNRAEYCGSVTAAEISAMLEFQGANPNWLTCDSLNLVPPGAHFDTVTFADLDGIFQKYHVLFQQRQLTIFRRVAWICQSPAAQGHIEYWMKARDLRKGISSNVAQFDTFAEACTWLVLAPEHAAMLESGEGFEEVARFDIPAITPAFSR